MLEASGVVYALVLVRFMAHRARLAYLVLVDLDYMFRVGEGK
jgi:hypothetical protein